MDDNSRKSWTYFMKTKNGVFGKFQEFKALVENQTGMKIMVLGLTMEWGVYLQGV
jgi:hypothetical protein